MPTDLKWNGTDIIRSADGDIATVSGTENIEQSLAILVRDEVGRLVGETITPATLASMEDALTQAIDRDPQVTGLRRIAVTEIDKRNNTITVKAETAEDETFVSEVNV